MAVDEFYSSTAVSQIQALGAPAFDCGQNYVRAPAFHYLAAAFSSLLALDTTVESMRLFSSIANILAVPAIFGITRRFHPSIAFVVCVLYVFSAWEMEFSRFARSYSTVVCFALWSTYFALKYHEGQRTSHFAALLVFTFLAGLSWEGGILFACLPVIIWWARDEAPRMLHVIGLAGVTIAALFGPRWLLEGRPPTGDGPLINPLGGLDAWDLVLTAALVLVGAGLAVKQVGPVRSTGSRSTGSRSTGARDWLMIAATVVLGSLGLLLAAGVALVMFHLTSIQRRAVGREFWSMVVFVGLCGLLWLGRLFLGDAGVYEAVIRLIDYPDIYRRFLAPWFQVMPAALTMLALANVASLLLAMRRESTSALRFVNVLVLSMVCLITIIDTSYVETRYTFFLYPFLLINGLMPLTLLASARSRWVGSAIAVVGFGIVSEDHSAAFVLAFNDRDHVFRVNLPEEVAYHYYLREDYRSAAEHIDDRWANGDLVIAGHQVHTAYLDHVDFVYKDVDSAEYQRVKCDDGVTERWTGLPLMSESATLWQRFSELPLGASMWILSNRTDFSKDFPDQPEPDVLQEDGQRLAVYRFVR